MNSKFRFAVVVLFLTITTVFLKTHAMEDMPAHESLASIPSTLGEWVGRDVAIPADVLKALGSGDFLFRIYSNLRSEPEVSVFVAYIPTQQAGDTLHSPQNCLPGAGWSPLETSTIVISLPSRPGFYARRYLIGKGSERALVYYWYTSHGRTFASEYLAKFYLVFDSIRSNRSDGSLVRIITAIPANEAVQNAEKRLLNFSTEFVPSLDNHISR